MFALERKRIPSLMTQSRLRPNENCFHRADWDKGKRPPDFRWLEKNSFFVPNVPKDSDGIQFACFKKKNIPLSSTCSSSPPWRGVASFGLMPFHPHLKDEAEALIRSSSERRRRWRSRPLRERKKEDSSDDDDDLAAPRGHVLSLRIDPRKFLPPNAITFAPMEKGTDRNPTRLVIGARVVSANFVSSYSP